MAVRIHAPRKDLACLHMTGVLIRGLRGSRLSVD
jgi:hypothetical protein